MAKKENNQASNQGKSGRLAEYFWANVVFWVFLLLVVTLVWNSAADPKDSAAIKKVLGDTRSFILILFGGGFTLVTLFDLAYDFFAERAAEEEGEPSR